MPKKPSRVSHEGLLHQMSIQHLLIFRDAFRNPGSSLEECAATVGQPKSNVQRVMKEVQKGLELGLKGKETIWEQARSAHPEDTIAGKFYSVVCELIEGLSRVKANRDKPRSRIFVAGGEFALICVMPRVLQKSGFLLNNPKMTLDLSRLLPEEAVRAVELGQADIALTPSPGRATTVKSHNLLQAGCGFINHEAQATHINKDPADLNPKDFKGVPIFVIRHEAAPTFTLSQYLKDAMKTWQSDQVIYVDSLSYVFHYVAKQLGVGLYYIPAFNPYDPLPPGVNVIPLKAEPPYPDAVFHLYWIEKNLTQEAEELRQAIIKYADPRPA